MQVDKARKFPVKKSKKTSAPNRCMKLPTTLIPRPKPYFSIFPFCKVFKILTAFLHNTQVRSFHFGINIAFNPIEPKPVVMEARQKRLGRREFFEEYISRINWDWLFLKGQIIFAAIIFLGIIGFILWIIQWQ